MRVAHSKLVAAIWGAQMAALAVGREARDISDTEAKTPPPPKPEPEKPKNLPGETNRQFAARMKTETPNDHP
jgi:hypothetical protein